MAKPFDATTKHLLETYPGPWLDYLGLDHAGRVEVLDVDLSTVTAEADKVFRLEAPGPSLAHLEFQSSYDSMLGLRLLRYNILLTYREGLPVRSVALLLRPEADGREMTGVLQQGDPGGEHYLEFRYKVVRAWERPVGPILTGPLGTLPMAPLADAPPEALPAVIRSMKERLDREAEETERADFWTSTYLLMGLRYSDELIAELLRGVRDMKESTTYQAILREGRAEGRIEGRAEGRIEGERRLLLKIGRQKFGEPDAETLAAIESLSSLEEIDGLANRLIFASSWKELLNRP